MLNKCLLLFLINAPGEKAVCTGHALSSDEDSLAWSSRDLPTRSASDSSLGIEGALREVCVCVCVVGGDRWKWGHLKCHKAHSC